MQSCKVLLQSLSSAGQQLNAGGEGENNATQTAIVKQLAVSNSHIKELQSLKTYAEAATLWEQAAQLGVSLADVSRALATVMSVAPHAKALPFAAWYMTLLRTPGCPVRSLIQSYIPNMTSHTIFIFCPKKLLIVRHGE